MLSIKQDFPLTSPWMQKDGGAPAAPQGPLHPGQVPHPAASPLGAAPGGAFTLAPLWFPSKAPFTNRGPGAASSHLGWPSAEKGALEMLGECSFSMHMYIGGEAAAKVNTTLPFPKMSSRNCKGSWSKNSVSDPLRFLSGEAYKPASF